MSIACGKKPDFKHFSICADTYQPDFKLLRKVPELATDIQHHEKHLADINKMLSKDVNLFNAQAERILKILEINSSNPMLTLKFNAYGKIQDAYNQYLLPWFDVRNMLVDEQLSNAIEHSKNNPDLARAQVILDIMKKTQRIRCFYAPLEIFIPILFAIIVISYVWTV